MKKNDIFDRIAASGPVNAMAAKVTSRGSHYEPKFNLSRQSWDTPPPLKPIPPSQAGNKNLAGIIGRKFGRLTVLGLHDNPDRSRQHAASWVVRCACGTYEIRKAKAIRNPLNVDDRCQRCHAVQKHQSNYQRLGSRAIDDFTKSEAAE